MKLFGKGGKLNIVDILIILVLLAALIFVAFKFLSPLFADQGAESDVPPESEVEEIPAPNIRFTVLCEDVSPAIAKQIMDSLEGEPRVLDGKSVERTRLYYANSLYVGFFVDWYTEENGDQVDLYLTIEALAEIYGVDVYSVSWQDIRIGKDFICKSTEIEITGVVYSLEPLQ